MNVVLNSFFHLIAIIIVFTGLIIYPLKRNKSKYTNFYARQKPADCILISATFLLTIYTGNSINTNNLKNYSSTYASSIINYTSNHSENISEPIINKNNSTVSKRDLRNFFRTTLKELRKKYKDFSKTGKTISIILVVLAAAFLISLLGALSCSIACSGSEALADIVFFVGLGGIIFGLVKLIQMITGRKKKHVVDQVQ